MTVARRHQIHIDTTPYYHCVSRCVRRAFLCGKDEYTGKNFEHRRQWLVDRIKHLSSIFAIDICAYSVMSNHYHLVLRVDIDQTKQWSVDEVIDRWCTLYSGHILVKRYREGTVLSSAEWQAVSAIVELWRTRLVDISWFMRCLNESIARQANQEDDCKGRFWQGRFKSQALLDETALLTCMVYVDLNPIRAGMCKTPESSQFTSIRERILSYKQAQNEMSKRRAVKITKPSDTTSDCINAIQAVKLLPFVGTQYQYDKVAPGIEFEQTDYFELVDWTGRQVRKDKSGAIPTNILSIMDRLQVNNDEWVNTVNHFGRRFYRIVGPVEILRNISVKFQRHWFKGLFQCQRLYKEKFIGVS